MARFGSTDFQWPVIQSQLTNELQRVARGDGRLVLNGIFPALSDVIATG